MPSWQRIVYVITLAVVEATPAALPLMLAGGRAAWLSMVVLVLLGALADWFVAGWLAESRQRWALLGIGAAAALWLVKVQLGLGVGLLAGWGGALGTLFSLSDENAGLAYWAGLLGLYGFWRGTRLLAHDTVSLRQQFSRSVFGLMVVLGLSAMGMFAGATGRISATTMLLMVYFAANLLAIALATAAEEHDHELRHLSWRSMVTLLTAIGAVLLLGLFVASLLGEQVAEGLSAIIQGVLLLVLLILTPFAMVILTVLEWVFRQLNWTAVWERIEQQQVLGQQEQAARVAETLGMFPPWVQNALQVLFALLPVLLVVLLIVLMRRRARRQSSTDEERESLWSWSGFVNDLGDMLAGFRRTAPEGGLRAALARLSGADPATRIRRAYVRLLLAAEAKRPRADAQTPREYEADAAAVFPGAQQSIARLTRAYEQARYHPEATQAADADAAEQAWQAIEAQRES